MLSRLGMSPRIGRKRGFHREAGLSIRSLIGVTLRESFANTFALSSRLISALLVHLMALKSRNAKQSNFTVTQS